MMANNILEHLDELYSRWSMAEKVGKEMQLARLWQQARAAYIYLFQVYQNRGYLTPQEVNYANQINQMLMALQSQKMKVDQNLVNEMMKHIAKMILER